MEQDVARTIIITGAGDGLGRTLARRLAADGDTVILLGRTLAKIQAVADELGAPALAVQCDVASPASVRAAFATIAAAHPTIDVLVNNAAVYEPFTVADASDAQIQASLQINLAGPIYCARAVIPMMARGGHIINISSESITVGFPMLSLYQASKAGLERFGTALARELEPAGIRVTTVRAGQMMEEGKTVAWPIEAAMAFGQACMAAGINPRERPISHFKSVAESFRAIIDTPADLQLETVVLTARRP